MFVSNNKLLQMETCVNNIVEIEGLPKLQVNYQSVLDRLYTLQRNINDVVTVISNIAIVQK